MGVLPVFWIFILHAVWCAGETWRLLVSSLHWMQDGAIIAALGIMTIPAIGLGFILEYVILKRKAPVSYWLILLVEPVISSILLLSDTYTSLTGIQYRSISVALIQFLAIEPGIGTYAHSLYSLILIGASIFLIMRSMVNSENEFQWQLRYLLIAFLLPSLIIATEFFRHDPFKPFLVGPVSFFIVQACVFISIPSTNFLISKRAKTVA